MRLNNIESRLISIENTKEIQTKERVREITERK